MARTMKITGLVLLLVLFTVQMAGCFEYVKNKGGAKLQSSGKDRMDQETGTDTENTSILGDVGNILTGVFSGKKDWNSLFAYFIALGLMVLGQVLQGKKIKKKFIAEGELKDKSLELVTGIIGRFIRGDISVAVPDNSSVGAGRIVATEIAKIIEVKSGAKHTEVGSLIHKAVKKSKTTN